MATNIPDGNQKLLKPVHDVETGGRGKGKSRSVWVDQPSTKNAIGSGITPYAAAQLATNNNVDQQKQLEYSKSILQHKKSEEKLIPSKSEKKLPTKKK